MFKSTLIATTLLGNVSVASAGAKMPEAFIGPWQNTKDGGGFEIAIKPDQPFLRWGDCQIRSVTFISGAPNDGAALDGVTTFYPAKQE